MSLLSVPNNRLTEEIRVYGEFFHSVFPWAIERDPKVTLTMCRAMYWLHFYCRVFLLYKIGHRVLE